MVFETTNDWSISRCLVDEEREDVGFDSVNSKSIKMLIKGKNEEPQ